ncbi:hypothetical protein [Actinoplanes sp. NPDC049265]|uniref:hypothetical protein n=1 Tax=Actinoplanes sp. NPDC049265 TaxID=3363902 RepID=UPI00372031A2
MSIDHRPAVRRRPGAAARRAGYLISVAVNVMLLWLINVSPGWAVVPVLTAGTVHVLTLINASLIAGVVVNALQVAYDPPWLVNLGGLVTTGIGVAAMIRLWQVFPFAFTGSFDWAMLARILLVLGIAGSLVAMVVQVARLAGDCGRPAAV